MLLEIGFGTGWVSSCCHVRHLYEFEVGMKTSVPTTFVGDDDDEDNKAGSLCRDIRRLRLRRGRLFSMFAWTITSFRDFAAVRVPDDDEVAPAVDGDEPRPTP